jgi:HAD superfamily hydrolase (TIGR01509 family)
LRKQGRRLALFTASEVMAATAAMMRNGVLQCFDLIINTAETGFTKDDPRAYFEVLRRLGTTAESTVILEDAAYAVVGARKTGMRVIMPSEFPQLLGMQ